MPRSLRLLIGTVILLAALATAGQVGRPDSRGGQRLATAQERQPSLVLTRPVDAGMALLAAEEPDAPLREIATLPDVRYERDFPGHGGCAALPPQHVVCGAAGRVIAYDLLAGTTTPLTDPPDPANLPTIDVTPGIEGDVYVVETTLAQTPGSSPVQPSAWRLGRVLATPAPVYTLIAADTWQHVGPATPLDVVGQAPGRGLVYIARVCSDPGRGSIQALDQGSGAEVARYEYLGRDGKPGAIGAGALTVSPDGQWLVVGSGLTPASPGPFAPGFPSGVAAYLFALAQPLGAPRGVAIPADLEFTGALWRVDGSALVVAHASNALRSTTAGRLWLLDPVSNALTAGPSIPGTLQNCAGSRSLLRSDPEGRWLVIGNDCLDIGPTALELGTDRLVVVTDSALDRAVGWLQAPER